MNRSLTILWLTLIFRLIEASYNCDSNEFYAKKSCFRLLSFRNIFGVEHEYIDKCQKSFFKDLKSNTPEIIRCLNHLDLVLKKIANILINDLKLTNNYEFGILNSNDPHDQAILNHLIKKYSNYSSLKYLRIFMSSFFNNHDIYIKSQPNEGEFPNVMLHDEDLDSNLKEKCIYGKAILNNIRLSYRLNSYFCLANRTQNSDESFSFFLGDCTKRIPFICVKPFEFSMYEENYNLSNRCSYLNKVAPGGNWYDCERLVPVMENVTMSKSQKCCMFNIEWKKNFNEAKKVCGKFNSNVYSLKIKGNHLNKS